MDSTDSSPSREQGSPSLLVFIVTNAVTVLMISSGVMGLVPQNPLTSPYQKTIEESFPPEFVGPVNAYLGSIGAPPISDAKFSYWGEASGPDPAGWAMEQVGVSAHPEVAAPNPVFDPARVLLSTVGLPTPSDGVPGSAPDPGLAILEIFGLNEPAPPVVFDPAGLILGAAPPETATILPFDPAGVILGYVLPPGTPTDGSPVVDLVGMVTDAMGPWVTGIFNPPASPPSTEAVSPEAVASEVAATVPPEPSEVSSPDPSVSPPEPTASEVVEPTVEPSPVPPFVPPAPPPPPHPSNEPNPPTDIPIATATETVIPPFTVTTTSTVTVTTMPTATVTTTSTATVTTTSTPTDAAPYVVNTSPFNGETGVSPSANIVITFSEPVNVSATEVWLGYAWSLGGTGIFSATVSGSGTSVITLDPTVSMPVDPYYIDVSIAPGIISDVDLNDPPDTMAAGYSFKFYAGAPPTPSPIILYEYGAINGSLGGRAGADDLCGAVGPAGYTQYHAFISTSATDTIANMPANYGIPTSNPVQSITGIVLANNWADLLDGNINSSLLASGVTTSSAWWSGAEDNFGNAGPATSNCFDWTDLTGFGNYGNATITGAGWMYTANATCDNTYALICVASP